MNKTPLLHHELDSNSLFKSYYLALIPLLIFSIYKNGFVLYNADLINFFDIFLPLLFYLVSIGIGFLISFITKEKPAYNILICLICAASVSMNSNILIYAILLFVVMFILKYLSNRFKMTFNNLSLVRLFLLLSLLINSYSYLNIGEKLHKFNYSLFDIFIAHAPGGLATSSMLLLIISFIILALNKYYKKIISLSSSLVYLSLGLIYILISHNYDFLPLLFNGTIYFSFIFVAADIKVSPYSSKGMLIYGVFIGLTSFLISIFLNIYEAGYLSIFFISLFIPLINKIINKKYLHS